LSIPSCASLRKKATGISLQWPFRLFCLNPDG
jgi:hypothetical protein